MRNNAAKPHTSFAGAELYPNLSSKAAALYEAIVNYYVFIDGNKRTGVAALGLFLHRNSFMLQASDTEIETFTIQVAASHPDLADVAAWVERHSKPNAKP